MSQGKVLVSKRYDMQRTKIQGNNSIRVATVKADILDSGATSIYVEMALSGKDIRINSDGEREVVGELEQCERMKALRAICDYVMPRAKEQTVQDDNTEKWRKLIESLNDTEQ